MAGLVPATQIRLVVPETCGGAVATFHQTP
jgi:hypothetical protein